MAAAVFAPPEDIPDGFDPEDYEVEPVEVWPDCWDSWQLFCEMSGQWRTSATGERVALDYTPLLLRMEHLGLTKEAWNDRYRDIRVIEGAALDAMQKKPPAPPATE